MSGFEIAGLAFGVVPILIEAITAYQTARDRLHTFSTYSSAVRRIHLRIKTQEHLFHLACRRLLEPLVSGPELLRMLKDTSHCTWQDQEFHHKWGRYLGEDYEICFENLKVITEMLREIETELCKHFGKLPLDGEVSGLDQLQRVNLTLQQHHHRWISCIISAKRSHSRSMKRDTKRSSSTLRP